jgi:outer membrane protein W
MRKLLLLALAMTPFVPEASRAQVMLGARLGYSAAMGDAFKEANTGQAVKMSDGIKSQIPIQIDAAYKLSKEFALGAYLAYGFGQVGGAAKDECSLSGQSCSAHDWRFGIQALYTFTQVSPPFVPWAGVGLGYEWGTYKQTGGGQPDSSLTLKGWEFLNLQLGGDYVVNPQLAVGPYVMFSIAQYSDAEVESGGVSVSGSIDKKAVHEWFGFGVRGRFDL